MYTYVGPQVLDLLGFPIEEWYQPSFWTDHIHADDRERAIATCTNRSKSDSNFEYRMVRADGEVVWIKDYVAVQREDGVAATLRGFLVDVTEEKALTAALEASEERVRRVLQESPDALLLVGETGEIINSNRMASDLFGYSQEELMASKVDRLLPDRLAERLAEYHPSHRERSRKNPPRMSMEADLDLVARRRNGLEFPVEITLSQIDRDGQTVVLASIRDLTERRQIESDMRERELLLRQMANILPALIAFIDKDQRYRYVNDNYATWLNVDPAQVVGKTVQDVVGEDLYARLLPGIRTVLSGSPVHYEMDFPFATGPTRPVEVSLTPQFDSDDAVSGYFVLVLDVSERVEAEEADRRHREALAHVSRLATMGELAASIAHEVNQPLSALVVNAQAAQRFLAAPSPDLGEIDDALGDIAEDAQRAGSVIRHMRTLLRKGEQRTEPVDLNALVTSTVDMLQSDAVARDVSVTVDLAESLPAVSGDPIQLMQVVLNVMVNAFEAVSEESRRPRLVGIKTSTTTNSIEISLTDNGPGLPDDIEGQAFGPFVSTKPDGLGLGLSISRSIVEAHHGQLLAENNSLEGATLRIILPVAPTSDPGAGA